MIVLLRLVPERLRWAIFLAAAMQFFEFRGWLAGPEGKILDFFLSDVPVVATQTPGKPIVTLEIDDVAFGTCFKSTSPLDPDHIAALVNLATGASVIGVDIVTDSQKDSGLETKIQADRSKVVWAAGINGAGLKEYDSFWDWLTGPQPIAVQPTAVLGHIPKLDDSVQWALPVYPFEEDLRVRRFPRRAVVPRGKSILNWASKIAQLYCNGQQGCRFDDKPEELFISSYTPRNSPYLVSALLDCKTGNPIEPGFDKFKKDADNAIVLIGGVFSSSRDFYDTPDGRKPGVELNADAVQAEITGTGISEVPPWLKFLLDIAVGLLIGWTFDTPRIRSNSVNSRLTICFGGILGTLILGATILYSFKFVWLSCVGIAIGMTMHALVEIWKKDLQLGDEERLEIREERVLKVSKKHVEPPQKDT